MNVLVTMFMRTVSTSRKNRCVDAFRRQDEGLGHVVVRSHGDNAGVGQSVEPAIRLSAKCDALLSDGAAAYDTEHAFAGEHDPDRPARDLRRCGREDLVLPKEFAAEAAANEGRRLAHLIVFQTEHLRDGPGFVRHRLRGVVDPQRVALRGEGRRHAARSERGDGGAWCR